MFRKICFQLHWLIGISAGIVLAIVGATGALMSFEEQILRALNSDVRTVQARPDGTLTPAQLLARIQTRHPDKRITQLAIPGDPEETARVTFAADKPGREDAGRGARGDLWFVDPFTGEILGESSKGQAFFRSVRSLHRWLVVGELGNRNVGKQVVGASTILLLVLALSGLYLRWPRRVAQWRAWFGLDFSLKGRAFLWQLHTVIGTCVLPLYLTMGLTGLYWSYDWYRDGLFAVTGTQRPERSGAQRSGGEQRNGGERSQRRASIAVDLTPAWEAFRRETADTGFKLATLTLPAKAGEPVEIRYVDADPPHTRASNTFMADAASGALLKHERYADKPAGAKLIASMFPLHSGIFFGWPGIVLYMLASLMLPLFAVTGWMLYLERRAGKKRRSARVRITGKLTGF